LIDEIIKENLFLPIFSKPVFFSHHPNHKNFREFTICFRYRYSLGQNEEKIGLDIILYWKQHEDRSCSSLYYWNKVYT